MPTHADCNFATESEMKPLRHMQCLRDKLSKAGIRFDVTIFSSKQRLIPSADGLPDRSQYESRPTPQRGDSFSPRGLASVARTAYRPSAVMQISAARRCAAYAGRTLHAWSDLSDCSKLARPKSCSATNDAC